MYLMTSLLVYIFIIISISNAAFPSFRDMLTKIINEAEDLNTSSYVSSNGYEMK